MLPACERGANAGDHARKTAGVSFASFGIDWTVKLAFRSEVKKRRPYPDSGFPPSSEKISVGI